MKPGPAIWLICVLFSGSLVAQVTVIPARIRFGEFTSASDGVIDVLLENRGDREEHLLRTQFGPDFETRVDTRSIPPGGQAVLRVRFNPRKTGEVREQALLWFASAKEPVVVPISATVLEANPNGRLPCPDFSERPAECCTSNMFLVEVVDDPSGEPLERAVVRLEEDGVIQLRLETNGDGRVSQNARIGYYSIRVEKPGYLPSTLESYVNHRNSRFLVRLKRDPHFHPAEDALYVPPADPVADSSALDPGLYRPNFVVFLLDVSGSMGSGDKLELLGLALSELSAILRPVDEVAVVSYAGEARVLLPPVTGDQRERLRQLSGELRAGGKTSGAKGFRRSYELLRSGYRDGANNQLIVITDGAFDPEDESGIDRLVARYASRGIRTSVVGIQSNGYASGNLAAVAQVGNGSFLRIDSHGDAREALVEEIKKQSRK